MMYVKRLYIILLLMASQAYGAYDVTVMAIFRDEAEYLDEWITYYEYIGVDHFLLYNHCSQDNYKDILQKYIDRELVTLIEWNHPEWPKAQLDAYRHGIRLMKGRTKWLAAFDVDEFLNFTYYLDIGDFLKDYEDYAGVAVHWQLFGTSNHYDLPSGYLMTKEFIHRAPKNYVNRAWIDNRSVKCIIRPDRINENSKHKNCGNHIFEPICPYHIVNTKEKALELHTRFDDICHYRAQLNHYWFRTEKYFWKTKVDRRACQNEKYDMDKAKKLMKDCNQIEDTSIWKLLPLDFLVKDPREFQFGVQGRLLQSLQFHYRLQDQPVY